MVMQCNFTKCLIASSGNRVFLLKVDAREVSELATTIYQWQAALIRSICLIHVQRLSPLPDVCFVGNAMTAIVATVM